MKKIIFIHIIILSLLKVNKVQAQKKDSANISGIGWICIGAGFGSSDNLFSINGLSGSTYIYNKNVLSIDFNIYGRIQAFDKNPEDMLSYGILYGRAIRLNRKGLLTYSVGLGLNDIMTHGKLLYSGGLLGPGKWEEIHHQNIGLIFHAQLFNTKLFFFTLGIDFAGNINMERSQLVFLACFKSGYFKLDK